MYRYRQGDQAPYLYQTNDYGKTWRRIADGRNGIPPTHFTRVVREDTSRKGLLFAGTEFGLYASWDDGTSWQSMQLNLPITPVTDLLVYRDDLIVATQGRGFYILENMAVPRSIRQGTTPAATLFKPEDAYRTGGQFPTPTFYYWLRDAPTDPITVEVTDSQNKPLLSLTVKPGAQAPEPVAAAVPAARGGGGGVAGAVVVAEAGRAGAGEDPEAGGGREARRRAKRSWRVGHGGQGLNRAVWTNLRLPSPYRAAGRRDVAAGVALQDHDAARDLHRQSLLGQLVESQTFRLKTDPRYAITDRGAEQLRLAQEVSADQDAMMISRAARREEAQRTSRPSPAPAHPSRPRPRRSRRIRPSRGA
jgi:hypothetical protein